jgi:hypothetical protein
MPFILCQKQNSKIIKIKKRQNKIKVFSYLSLQGPKIRHPLSSYFFTGLVADQSTDLFTQLPINCLFILELIVIPD